jgi:23S rRNA (uracil1939-C5)-methyltransferase
MAKFRSSAKPLRIFKPKAREVSTEQPELLVERLAGDGRGLGYVDGKTVFVTGALTGERVKIRYIACHKQFDEATVVKILAASPHRVEAACPHYGACGGCQLQHLSYPQQLLHKQASLQKQFAGVVSEDNWSPLLSDQPWRYRHRARLSVIAKRDGLNLGFKRQDSHQLIAIDQCHIVSSAIEQQFEGLKYCLEQLQRRSNITEILINEDSNGDLAIGVCCKHSLPETDLALLADYSVRTSCAVTVFNGKSNHWQWSVGEPQLAYQIVDHHITLPYTIKDFTQVNAAINQHLLAYALDWLQVTSDDVVADFFCGIGNFSLPFARQSAKVIGYEHSKPMVKKALISCQLNGVENAEFKVLNLMADKVSIKPGFNKALLDPPRAGAEQLCLALARSGVASIIYISCNPATLLRDMQHLLAAGYQLEKIALADMFPQTKHCEVISLFTLPRLHTK